VGGFSVWLFPCEKIVVLLTRGGQREIDPQEPRRMGRVLARPGALNHK